MYMNKLNIYWNQFVGIVRTFLSTKIGIPIINSIWICLSIYPIVRLLNKMHIIGIIIFFVFGIILLNIGMEGIRDKRIYMRSGYDTGMEAVRMGFFAIFGSLFFLFILYYLALR